VRDRTTPRSDFVFYADRLIRLVVEQGLGYLPFSRCTVTTPVEEEYHGFRFSQGICGVSVIRSGESMENALRACCKGVKIGKILIRRRGEDGEEGATSPCRIIYEKLPPDISRRYVLLLDPILASGNSALAAINLLLAKGVLEERIIFLTLVAAPQGVRAVCERYPKLILVTSEIDAGLSPFHVVVPGVGEFGDRYFGTEGSSTRGVPSTSERAPREGGTLPSSGSASRALDAALGQVSLGETLNASDAETPR